MHDNDKRHETSFSCLCEPSLSRGSSIGVLKIKQLIGVPLGRYRPGKGMKTPRILVFVPYGSWLVHNQVDAIVATACAARGAEVLVVRCDGLFMNGCYTLARADNPELACKQCHLTGDSFFRSFGLPMVQLREFLHPQAIDQALGKIAHVSDEALPDIEYQGVKLGYYASGPVGSYFRVTRSEITTGRPAALMRRYVAYGMVTYDGITELVERFSPTHLFMYNGVGFLHAAAFAVAKQRGIPVITHERGMHDGSFSVSINTQAGAPETMASISQAWESTPLTIDELTRIKDYFANREFGKDLNAHTFYTYQTSHTDLRPKLALPEEGRILAVYTSSEYELAYCDESMQAVGRQLDIIDSLLKVFEDRRDYLVVRHHPAIGVSPNGAPHQGGLLRKVYAQALKASSQVRIIMPNEEITSYALMWNSTASLVFFSSVRMEAAARGQPVATTDHPYINAGLQHRITDESVSGMSKLVDELFTRAEEYSIEDLRVLYRAAYAINFRHSVSFSSFSIKDGFQPDIRAKSVSDLREDAALNRICDCIFTGSAVYELPKNDRRVRSVDEEDGFLVENVAEIRRYRELVAAETREKGGGPESQPHIAVVEVCVQDDTPSLAAISLRKQRASPSEWCHFEPQAGDLLAQISAVIADSTAPFVALTLPHNLYDPGWLTTISEMIAEAPDREAWFTGAWLQDSVEKIESSFMSPVHSIDSLENIGQLHAALEDPLTVVSLGVFRREALLHLVSGCCDDSTAVFVERLNALAFSGRSAWRRQPLVVVCSARAAEAYVTEVMNFTGDRGDEPRRPDPAVLLQLL